MAETMTAAMEFDGTGGPWSAIEVTVRASMGELDGVTGIFDLTSDETEPDAKGVAAQSDRRNVIARANGFRYQYREVALGNHLIIRILLITDVISVMVLSALFVILRN
ncbi:hypothetical protein FBU59_007108 [Linderina macrospora]|uniref:Uncharacterized protein n=1 Tax=Linderina macrospora TaxID=4868 RepID=A0ACC1IY37_9FUNG|nr:hypothetical protein FBU59_007108 [Linderina macrospora]